MLATSRYSLEWIKNALIEAGEPLDPTAAVTYERIGDGRGFASAIYKTQIDGHNYVVKVPAVAPRGVEDDGKPEIGKEASGNDQRDEIMRKVHTRELDAYRWFKQQPGDLGAIGKFYTGEESSVGGREGVIIMEDFSGKMASGVDFVQGFDLPLVLNIVEQILRYQAASLSSDVEPPLPVCRLARSCMSGIGEQCVKQVPWLTEAQRARLISHSQPEYQLTKFIEYAPNEEGLSPVLIHFDLWPNNMLFTRDAEGAARLLALVDWQVASMGVCMLDIASILGVCMDAEERQAHTGTVIEFYVDQMNKRKAGFKRPFEITTDKAHSIIGRCFDWAELQLLMTLVYNPHLDVKEEAGGEGRLTRRLRELLTETE